MHGKPDERARHTCDSDLSLSLYIYIYIYNIPRLVLFVPTLDGLGMGSVWDRFGVGLGSVGTSQ